MPANIIATSFALIIFAASIAVGVAAQNPSQTILWRTSIAMLFCWPVGYVIGNVAQKTIERNIEQYKAAHPFPDDVVDDVVVESPVNVDIIEDG